MLGAPLCLQPGCFLLPLQVTQRVVSYYRPRARNSSTLVKFLLLEQHVDEPQSLSSPGYPFSGSLVYRFPTRHQFSDITVTGLVCMERKRFECTPEMFLLFFGCSIYTTTAQLTIFTSRCSCFVEITITLITQQTLLNTLLCAFTNLLTSCFTDVVVLKLNCFFNLFWSLCY